MPLVVGVDGSRASLEAVDWAVDEAVRHQVPMFLVHAAIDAGRGDADGVIGAATARARKRASALELTHEVLYDDPAQALTRKGRNAFAVVLGSRGRGDLTGLLLGSVSLAVAGRADCPVAVVRGAAEHRSTHFGRVVVGVEDGEGSGTATRFAFREAQARRSTLIAVHAWRAPVGRPPGPADRAGSPPETARVRPAAQVLDEALRALEDRYPQVGVERRTVDGPPRQALLEAASGADLLVVGARRRQGHFGLQLGLVNHGVLHHAPCPVAVVPQI